MEKVSHRQKSLILEQELEDYQAYFEEARKR